VDATFSRLMKLTMKLEDTNQGKSITFWLSSDRLHSFFSVFTHFHRAVSYTQSQWTMVLSLKQVLAKYSDTYELSQRVGCTSYGYQHLHSFETNVEASPMVRLTLVSDLMKRHRMEVYPQTPLICVFNVVFYRKRKSLPFLKILHGQHFFLATSGEKTIEGLGMKNGHTFIIGYQEIYYRPTNAASTDITPLECHCVPRANRKMSDKSKRNDRKATKYCQAYLGDQDVSVDVLRESHSKAMEPVLNELRPRLKAIRDSISALSL